MKSLGLKAATVIADAVVVTVDPKCISWLRRQTKAEFCPSPANIPNPRRDPPPDLFTVGCFGIGLTGDPRSVAQLQSLAEGISEVAGAFRLRILGANDPLPPSIEAHLRQREVTIEVPGKLAPEALATELSRCHVFCQLPVGLTTRSGTLAAALACGLPIIGMRSDEMSSLLISEGIEVVPEGDVPAMARAAAAMRGETLRQQNMEQANLQLAKEHFSWERARDVVLAAAENQ
jgi:glycosyltransferase involved in cell wall biosynthesis